MEQSFEQAKNLIDNSANILLTMHERMDGDDGGALLAMGHQLESLNKNVTYSIKKGVPPNLSFLPKSHKILDDISEQDNFDLLITFGCSSIERTGSEKITNLQSPKPSAYGGQENLKIKVINIDHHPDNTGFGQVNLVDAAKSSVAELVYDFFIFHNWEINKDIATCLLTGIITDTGSFMHANTQSSTLKAAAELMRKGAQVSKIVRQTYKNKSPQILKAWGRALKNAYYDSKNKIIYSVMTENDLAEFSALPQAAFEGFVETLNTVPEAKFAMFLRQDGNIIKGSLRSDTFKNTDVSQIARIFGGGGHKLASGFSVAGKLMKDEMGKWKVA
ncbi:MAG: bifunctional oligoribonuclease/PAP phosphatase NrnA [Candidatus Doudnabacteria bacterium]|nr:bifunctional oligoribonuclease/PAP phosphatase NrnA [Candidatus Doudnabacteria bacterium]